MTRSSEKTTLFRWLLPGGAVRTETVALSRPFGEVWWVSNAAWARISRLRLLADRDGCRPGLCIRPPARLMAFGTAKVAKARRSLSRRLEVPPGGFPGSSRHSTFLLDYAVPVAWADVALIRPPGRLNPPLLQQLATALEVPPGHG